MRWQTSSTSQKKRDKQYFITVENEFCQQMAHLFPFTSMDSWHLIYLLRIGSNGVKKERERRRVPAVHRSLVTTIKTVKMFHLAHIS